MTMVVRHFLIRKTINIYFSSSEVWLNYTDNVNIVWYHGPNSIENNRSILKRSQTSNAQGDIYSSKSQLSVSYSRFSDLFAKDATLHEVSEVVMMNFKGARL
ncbi:hypothetical protein SAMN05660330_03128 [Desulforhopalus singaporensis]|uniref:Uncharacterized protein n=1 Tax=Desulforhopalus singaporensis TaxID=91360 RepID=A0A1H0TJ11_9BACT|nr:hypothetical protein SAMN05660330_03128 [Desulforhopalus singaporensis]